MRVSVFAPPPPNVEKGFTSLHPLKVHITIAIRARFDDFDLCAAVGLLEGVSKS
jgi:hypothetical protein